MASGVKVGGTWQPFAGVHVKVGGVWQECQKVHVKVSGVWQEVYAALSVVVSSAKTIFDTAFEPGDAYAAVRVGSDGDLYESTTSFISGFTSYETWLDKGSNTEVWVECTIVSGSLDSSAGTGSRLACTSNRTWGISQTSIGAQETVIDLEFYDASSGGNLLDTQRVTLQAEVEV